MKTVKEAIASRRTTSEFDTELKISDADLTTILEAGRLAPSGLGSEPTRLLVIRDETVKKEVVSHFDAMNARKVLTSDSLILFISKNGDTFKSREFIKSRLERWNLTPEELNQRVGFYQIYLNNLDNADTYAVNQAFITLGYISIQASALMIDSTIMTGFKAPSLTNYLAEKGYIDSETEKVTLSIALGYATKEAKEKVYPQIRLPLDKFVEII